MDPDPAGSSSRFTFGDYEIDVERGDLRCRGEPVEIQATPLKLLAHLAVSPGEVISPDELIETVNRAGLAPAGGRSETPLGLEGPPPEEARGDI